jgi:hypothetical protein
MARAGSPPIRLRRLFDPVPLRRGLERWVRAFPHKDALCAFPYNTALFVFPHKAARRSDGYYVPVTHSWMLGFYWVAPWCPIEGEDMMLPKKWCSRWFYFGDSPVPKSLRRTVYDWLKSV